MAIVDLTPTLTSVVKRFPKLSRMIRKIARAASPEIVIVLDYPVKPLQRWSLESPHPALHRILERERDKYRDTLKTFLPLRDSMSSIQVSASLDRPSTEPHWENGWIPPLDGASIYGFIATQKPKIYMEIGSGNSTKFARKAINDFGLPTEIVSIDPEPRADVDTLCDSIVRKPAEDIDIALFDRLNRNDILFVDSSHRIFMNSDVTALFLDILPRLNPGVLVQIHDIFLPYDYPPDWTERWYSEQYLLAAMLLADGNTFEVVLPNMFISQDVDLLNTILPFFERDQMDSGDIFGNSFWIRVK